jgi:thioredoxin-related protein
MKLWQKFSVLVFLFFYASVVQAQNETHFDQSGYQKVLQRSKKEHKPIFYLIYAEWCPHCTKMKAEVFKDSTVANFMNKNFICAWQDLEKGEGEFFKKKYGIRAFPTFLFLDETGALLYGFNGEYQSAAFLTEVKNVLVPEKQLPYLEKQFYADPSNGDKCLAFLTTLKKGTERTMLNPHAQKYFATQSDAQMVSEVNWRIIANGVSDIESRPFQYVLQHQKEFAGVSSPKRIQKKMANIVSELLEPYTITPDTINYFKKRPIAQSLHIQKTDSIIFRYDMLVAIRTDNWKSYKKITTESAGKFVWGDAKALQEIGQNYWVYVDDTESLKNAIRWVAHAQELNETYEGELLLSKLYKKINDPKTALAFAQKAKDRNGSLGFNTKEADELLLQLGTK